MLYLKKKSASCLRILHKKDETYNGLVVLFAPLLKEKQDYYYVVTVVAKNLSNIMYLC